MFGQTSDLLIDWEAEPIPDVATIRQACPPPMPTLKPKSLPKSGSLLRTPTAASVASSSFGELGSVAVDGPTSEKIRKKNASSLKTSPELRRRLSSSSSSSSKSKKSSSSRSTASLSSSSERSRSRSRSPSPAVSRRKLQPPMSFIPLSNGVGKGGKRKFEFDEEDLLVLPDLSKLSKKKRKKILFNQRKAAAAAAVASFGGKGGLGAGGVNPSSKQSAALAKRLTSNFENFLTTSSKQRSGVNEPASRRTVRSIYELERVKQEPFLLLLFFKG